MQSLSRNPRKQDQCLYQGPSTMWGYGKRWPSVNQHGGPPSQETNLEVFSSWSPKLQNGEEDIFIHNSWSTVFYNRVSAHRQQLQKHPGNWAKCDEVVLVKQEQKESVTWKGSQQGTEKLLESLKLFLNLRRGVFMSSCWEELTSYAVLGNRERLAYCLLMRKTTWIKGLNK